MKKFISILVCVAMLMAMASTAFAAGIKLDPDQNGAIGDKGSAGSKLPATSENDTSDSVAGGNTSDSVAGGNTSDSVAGGDNADRPAGGNTADTPAGGDNADRPAGGNTSDSVAGGDNADRPAGGNTSDSVAGGDNADKPAGGDNADKPAGGDTSDTPAGGDNADKPAGGETPAEPAKPIVDFANQADVKVVTDDTTTTELEDKVIWQQNGITVTIDRARAQSSGAKITEATHKSTWTDHTRFQKNNRVTIEYPNMKSIKFTFKKASSATTFYSGYMASSIVQYPGVSYEISEDRLSMVVTFTAPVDSFVIPSMFNTAQVLSLEIVDTFAEGETGTPMQASKTLTVKDLVFTTHEGRWCYNQTLATSGADTMYDMVIFDNTFDG